jgi:hypothetical protein
MDIQTSSEPKRFCKLEVSTQSGVQYEAEATDSSDATDKLLPDPMPFLPGIQSWMRPEFNIKVHELKLQRGMKQRSQW